MYPFFDFMEPFCSSFYVISTFILLNITLEKSSISLKSLTFTTSRTISRRSAVSGINDGITFMSKNPWHLKNKRLLKAV